MPQQTHSSCLNILLGISKGLSKNTSINKTLEDICEQVNAYFSPRHLAFLFLEAESGDLTFSVVFGEKKSLVTGKKLRKGRGVAGWVAEKGEPLLIENTATDPRFQTYFQTTKTRGSTSIMAVPLKSGDIVYGVLELIDRQDGRPFTASDRNDLMAIADITSIVVERAYYFQAMRRMAETDPLTGLPNKRTFDRHLEREIEVCKRYGTPSTVILVTLDNIRSLNEEHGVTAVDKIIQTLGHILSEEVRKVDLPCRIGADKYAILMPNTSGTQALDVGSRIHTKIKQQALIRDLPPFSVSIASHSGSQDDVTPLMGISTISKAGTQGFRKFRNVAANLSFMIMEEKQAMERRQYYRKNVQLAGRYQNPKNGAAGDIIVDNISLNGIGFTTLVAHDLEKNELLRVQFQLDDSRRTDVTRSLKVRYIKERYIGCQFVDTKSYDSDLGFYLMQ